jgi:hypothetical protein
VHLRQLPQLSLEQGIESTLVVRDQLPVVAHFMISDVHVEIRKNLRHFLKALQSPRQKAAPLQALALWNTVAREMDHFSNVGVIPAPEWDARNEVSVIHDPEGQGSQ